MFELRKHACGGIILEQNRELVSKCECLGGCSGRKGLHHVWCYAVAGHAWEEQDKRVS